MLSKAVADFCNYEAFADSRYHLQCKSQHVHASWERALTCLGQSYGGIVPPKVARYPKPSIKAQYNHDCREREDCPIDSEERWAKVPMTGCRVQWIAAVHGQSDVSVSVDNATGKHIADPRFL